MKLEWEIVPALDFFTSLNAVFDPDPYDLRASWAAGMRSRLPEDARDLLAELHAEVWLPVPWLRSLPKPHDTKTMLAALAAIPAAERVTRLLSSLPLDPAVRDTAAAVVERGRWTDNDLQVLMDSAPPLIGKAEMQRKATHWLNIWQKAPQLGPAYLDALHAYHDAFFAEEEQRIRPVMEKSVAAAQALAAQMPAADLLEHLSQGIRYELPAYARRIVLVPSFWSTPLIIDFQMDDETLFFGYGARPADMSLVPGEMVPDDLQTALKALSNATRLKMLRQLAAGPATPTDLSQGLRLRPSTVTHHLKLLRRARLVTFQFTEGRGRGAYELRPAGIARMEEMLHHFLLLDVPPADEEAGSAEPPPTAAGRRLLSGLMAGREA